MVLHHVRRVSTLSRKPFYITTPIFYPNASPHIGHLYSLVTADVFARYQRLKNRQVRFLAGTDEHGMKIQRASLFHFGIKGKEKEFCDILSAKFQELAKLACISNTCFMRTSSEEHHRAVEDVWTRLSSKGYIYKSQYSGWYSVTDECFYAKSQVSSDHENTFAIETGSAVEWCSEENYMFRLSAFKERLLDHYTTQKNSVYPPQYRGDVFAMLGAAPIHRATSSESSEDANAVIEDFELSDISISRPRSRLEWGVKVPGDPEQTVYVWFDALLIYLTGAGYPWGSRSSLSPTSDHDSPSELKETTSRELDWWPADLQIIGKDILRFHAVYLPAILMALSGESFNSTSSSEGVSSLEIAPVKTILTHAHWTAGQQKMSKSLGNVADPVDSLDRWGVDVVRFYLMRVGGRWRSDVDWSPQQLSKHRKEIHSQLGNYFLRISSPLLAERSIPDGIGLPNDLQRLFFSTEDENKVVSDEEPSNVEKDPNHELLRMTLDLPKRFETCMDNYEAGQAISEIMAVLKTANKTLTDIAPWGPATPPSLIHTTRVVGFESLRVVAVCLSPFMPTASSSLLKALGLPSDEGLKFFAPNSDSNGWHGKQELDAFSQRWNERKLETVKLF